MNKKLLHVELDFDFKLIALTSPSKDYRLCFAINKFTESDFRKTEDLEISLKNAPKKFFSRYVYYPENIECEFIFLANKGNEGFLIPEMKAVDYFILIKEFIDEEDLELFLSQLKQLNEIQAVVELDPEKIKSKENLIF
ncbi:IPExxxVDY family protein [Pedobacter arcticus]|uniref:IPExxxVDY family protein n=1 Tax=Pedobacter arcticus TaxID=752140 RepID=UPI00036F7E22|nr:IPExxxVDY family protein [Pedobacter arcticus]